MAVDDKAEPLRPDSPVHVVMVDVTAPATLPAGYEFDAQVDGGDPELTVHAVVVSASAFVQFNLIFVVDNCSLYCPEYSLKEVLLREMYFRFQWKREQLHREDYA